jgi:hypothetical protein
LAWKSQIPRALEPTMILINGKVITVDDQFSLAQAVAIGGNQIVAVGTNEEISALQGSDTRVIDLHGKTVIPGLMDNHNHNLNTAVGVLKGLDLSSARSIADIQRMIAAEAKRLGPGAPIWSPMIPWWDHLQLKEKRVPTRWDLDEVAPNNPVMIYRGHEVIVNSLILNKLGITRDSQPPPGGSLTRDERGELTGEFVDNAMRMVASVTPRFSVEDKIEAVKLMMKKFNEVGLTSIREPGLSLDDMDIYFRLWRNGELTTRLSMMLRVDPSKPMEKIKDELTQWCSTQGFGDDMLRMDGIKLGIDGGYYAGLMSQPYQDDPKFYGLQRIPTDVFDAIVDFANQHDGRVGVHTVGDKGLDIILDAYEHTSAKKSIVGRRWTVEHAFLVRPDQFDRIKNLGLVISTQDHTYNAASSNIKSWGRARVEAMMPIHTYLQKGIRVCGGTDWGVEPYNPFVTMQFWVTRRSTSEGVLGTSELISREEGLKMQTIYDAYLTFDEKKKGSIEPGKLADVVVISDDYLTVAEDHIQDIKVLMTILGGKIVYERPGGI